MNRVVAKAKQLYTEGENGKQSIVRSSKFVIDDKKRTFKFTWPN